MPLIWIIQEDNLSSRLQVYELMGWEHLISHWKSAFGRASVVVFPDFTFPVMVPSNLHNNTNIDIIRHCTYLSCFVESSQILFLFFGQMLYSAIDTGNFFVIPGSPVDAWAAESYSKTHSKYQLRELGGYYKDDILVLVVGSSIFYDDLSWEYAVAMHAIGPLLLKYGRRTDASESYKFIFLCGNSTDGYDDALQVLFLLRCTS